MSIRNPVVPTLQDPVLADVPLGEIQTNLSTGLAWLTNAYGKCEKRAEQNSKGKLIYYPAIPVGVKEYLKLFPDDHLGSFSFFYQRSPDDVEDRGSYLELTSSVSLIVWFKYTTIYPADSQAHTIEHVKHSVLGVLKGMSVRAAKIMVKRVFQDTTKIYEGFTTDEIQNQFHMRPYGGLRVDFEMKYKDQTIC